MDLIPNTDPRIIAGVVANVVIMIVYALAVIVVARDAVFKSAWTRWAIAAFFAHCSVDHASMLFHSLTDPVYRGLYALKLHHWLNLSLEAAATALAALGVHYVLNNREPERTQRVPPLAWGFIATVFVLMVGLGWLNL